MCQHMHDCLARNVRLLEHEQHKTSYKSPTINAGWQVLGGTWQLLLVFKYQNVNGEDGEDKARAQHYTPRRSLSACVLVNMADFTLSK